MFPPHPVSGPRNTSDTALYGASLGACQVGWGRWGRGFPVPGARNLKEPPGEGGWGAQMGVWIFQLEGSTSAGAEDVEGHRVGAQRWEEPARQERVASREPPQVSCQKLNHKKAGREQQGKEGEKGDGEEGRGGTVPPHQ